MPVIIHPPFVGYGKTDEVTNATAGNDTQTITFDNSGGDFDIGELVFVSKADDSEIQLMGAMTADLGGAGITCEYYTNSNKGAGDVKVWIPTYGFKFTLNFSSPAIVETDEGTESFRMLGGAVYSVQFSDGGDLLEWRFEKMWIRDWKEWIDFLRDDRDKGLEAFTAAWFDFEDIDSANPTTSFGVSRVARVKNGSKNTIFRSPHLGAAQAPIRLLVDTYDEYVTS